jgi:hypothetical protein
VIAPRIRFIKRNNLTDQKSTNQDESADSETEKNASKSSTTAKKPKKKPPVDYNKFIDITANGGDDDEDDGLFTVKKSTRLPNDDDEDEDAQELADEVEYDRAFFIIFFIEAFL